MNDELVIFSIVDIVTGKFDIPVDIRSKITNRMNAEIMPYSLDPDNEKVIKIVEICIHEINKNMSISNKAFSHSIETFIITK